MPVRFILSNMTQSVLLMLSSLGYSQDPVLSISDDHQIESYPAKTYSDHQPSL